LKITFISAGPIKKRYVKEGFYDYIERLKRYLKVEVVEVKEGRASKKTPVEETLREEGERILKRLRKEEFKVVLADKGTAFTSRGLAALIKRLMDGGKDVCFVVGGPFGVHGSVLEEADALMSLSRMTLPHDLARLVISEQVYRALTIIRGEPYSH